MKPISLHDFALQLYARPGMEALCLSLQDEHDADVNMLLFLCWRGHTGHRITQQELNVAVGLSRRWSESVTAPLRDIRRWMKQQAEAREDPAFSGLREGIKHLELEAELYQLQRLAALDEGRDAAHGTTSPATAIHDNLVDYARLARLQPSPPDDCWKQLVRHSRQISGQSDPASG